MTTGSDNSAEAIALKLINHTSRHVFLTGKAGTGKTTFLKNITEYTHKNTIVAAPTGIAAINAGGVTLHSLFQLPFGAFIPSNTRIIESNITTQVNTPQSLLKNLQMNKSKRRMLELLELLIIDEVSMLRADLLDAIDIILRHIKKQRNIAFGNVQILFIGDLLQLPPVVKEEEWNYLSPYYQGIYFFNAKALQQNKPLYIELEKIYRQSDNRFISLLNNLRDNTINKDDIQLLNKYYKPSFQYSEKDGFVYLTTHNRKADERNRQALKKLPGKSCFFNAEIEGDFSKYHYPLEYKLELKKGAQVMFIKNDYSGEQRYFNGKIGFVSKLSAEQIKINFNDGTPSVFVDHYTWENKKYKLNKETNEIEENIVGSFSHYPLKLAWAITVHKSQGLTFQKAIIDVSRAFAPGQIYVALSRLTSLDGLVLTGSIPFSVLKQDSALNEFIKTRESSVVLKKVLKKEIHNFIVESVLESFNFNSLYNIISYHVDSYSKDDKKSIKQKYKSWAKELQYDLKAVKELADKFSGQLRNITSSQLPGYLTVLLKRVIAAKDYFEPLLNDFSKSVFEHINGIEKQKRIKTYTNELRDIEQIFFRQVQLIYKSEALIDSAIHDTGISKTSLVNSTLYEKRKSMIRERNSSEIQKNESKRTKRLRKKSPKEVKPHSRELSYQFFQEGKSLKEIAAERSFAISTIEGHLAYYVARGQIDISQFVDQYKVKQVIDAFKKLDTLKLGAVKEYLGSGYSYGDLRMVLAHYINRQSPDYENNH